MSNKSAYQIQGGRKQHFFTDHFLGRRESPNFQKQTKLAMNKTIADVTIELSKQKAKELELASYKNDMKYFKVLLKPKNVKQIALEAEDYNKKIRKGHT